MRPVLTPQEMAAVDAAAPEPVGVLVERAGASVARRALALLGGAYGRRVVVVAGKGNNGNDGRAAARRLARRGVRTTVVPASEAPARLPPADLVIDAAFGTGFRGGYRPPDPGSAPVLAVDIPSGVDGLTGIVGPTGAVSATATVTFAALKPGLLFLPGRSRVGDVDLVDIGLDVSAAATAVVEAVDVAAWLPPRPADSHKWRSAVMVAAGSAGMSGAAHLAVRAAQRTGAGMVRVAMPGLDRDPALPTEAVAVATPSAGWDTVVLEQLGRARALVIGPGLGRSAPADAAVGQVLAVADVPTVVDGDGLAALGDEPASRLAGRPAPTVLTPHDGEFARLTGHPPGDDRLAAARALAATTGAVVVLKGPTTVVAHPDGRARLSLAGDARLATAGTGDVLSGIVGALLARGMDAFDAAAAGAWLHGYAAGLGPRQGMVASDVVDALPRAQDKLAEEAGRRPGAPRRRVGRPGRAPAAGSVQEA
ncbi:MAG TPA: NAD(P)H-hydrate dehydratase [Acidimicrobiales bacterium]|nr:NAD(P)H-hydrate dehydratase [Acidimicrobiales bacterium]